MENRGMYIHPSNKEAFQRIVSLRDESGRQAIQGVHLIIVFAIGRFPRSKGNFMRLGSIIRESLCRPLSERTLRRHIRYLQAIGAVEIDETKAMRLCSPPSQIVQSLCEFRGRLGMSEYSYKSRKEARMSDQNRDDFFVPTTGKICLSERQILPLDEANFASHKESNRVLVTNDLYNRQLPLSPLAAVGSEGATETLVSMAKIKKTKTTPEVEKGSEPIKPKRVRQPKTTRERRSKAVGLINKGHIANPIGVGFSRGRRLRPGLARPVGAEGAVSLPQLWASMLKFNSIAYGNSVDLEAEMQGTRENVARYFSAMKQKFIESCGCEPTNRELYQYLEWFYHPERVARYKNGERPIYHTQLLGLVYVRRFYDQNLRFKSKGEPPPSDKLAKEISITRATAEAYESFRTAGKDNVALLAMEVVRYGVVLYAEYLHEDQGLDGRQAKKNIIELMAKYVAASPNPSKAAEYVAQAVAKSRKSTDVKSSIWQDWESECKDMVELALAWTEGGKHGRAGK